MRSLRAGLKHVAPLPSFRLILPAPLARVRTIPAIACLLPAAAGGLLCAAMPAGAHPHVFADGHVVLDLDARHELAAVTNIWTFDPAFSAFAVTGLDTNGDGRLESSELKPLAAQSMDSLKDYHFFTWAMQGGRETEFTGPRDYSYRLVGGRLVLRFTMPLKAPLALDKDLKVEVFDPEYFVAYTFPKRGAVEIDGNAASCTAVYTPPKELDDAIMAKLAAIPVDQHDLPPALQDAALGLAHIFTVACP